MSDAPRAPRVASASPTVVKLSECPHPSGVEFDTAPGVFRCAVCHRVYRVVDGEKVEVPGP